jgi:L-lactate utilization protein LutC
MSSNRDRFLQTVRRAVAEGNRAGHAPPRPERGDAGYQGGGPDPLARFREACAAAGGQVHVVADQTDATAKVIELVRACAARRVLLGTGSVVDSLRLVDALGGAGLESLAIDPNDSDANRAAMFRADAAITGVDYLVAETGSVVVISRPDQPRSVSLLPPVHIAVATRDQLLPDLFDLFERHPVQGRQLPACVSVITGPSKTGDIELRLVTGVHGPGEVHIVVIDSRAEASVGA